jgi:DNA-directed RNA polymerase specialized sigma24 family protein
VDRLPVPLLAAAYGMALHLTGNRDGAEELSYQEIAEIVGCPVGTVRSRRHRGRTMPQKALWYVADLQGMVADLRASEE